ncbi:MAG: S41 family peptidase, partial [Bacteroidota bacterium]
LPLALRKMSDTHHRLITYRKRFKPANKHQYDGELIVLINEQSFSAASLLAGRIKSEQRGLLYGSVSSGAYRGTYGGYFGTIKLKASGLFIRLPRFEVVAKVDPQLNALPLLTPDVVIPLQYTALLQGKDVQLEKAMEN